MNAPVAGLADSEPGGTDTSRRERLIVYDAAKLLCALGVVFFHAQVPFAQTWYAGMFLFVFFVGYMPGRPKTVVELLKSRTQRLLVPWLFWCIVYSPLYWMNPAYWYSKIAYPELFLFVGPHITLWFLPYAFAAGVILGTLRQLPVPNFSVRLALLMLMVAGTFAVMLMLDAQPPPVGQWLTSLPMVIAGFLIAMGTDRRETAIMLGALMAISAIAVMLGQENSAWQMLVIAPLCFFSVTIRRPGIPMLAYLGDLAFGIYLIHPAVSQVTRRVIPSITADHHYVHGLILFGASLATAALLRTTRFGRMIT